jgi:RimJ/RimL family protein N-acetyltransferase
MTKAASQVLFIRPMVLSDIATIAHWFSDPDDLALFERSAPLPPGRDMLEARWKDDLTAASNEAKAYWYIVCHETGAPVAIGGLQSIDYINGNCVLPIFIAKTMRGRGVGIRLTALLLDFAFNKLRLTRVTTYYREDNRISAKLVARAAFKIEGTMRKSWFVNGKHLDMIMAGVLQEDWLKSRAALLAALGDSIVLQIGEAGPNI